jgi:hypothetical protein
MCLKVDKMEKEMYINGKKFYPKEMQRLTDEIVMGEKLISFKDRNNNYVHSFIFKDEIKLPKESTLENLRELVGLDSYGNTLDKNVKDYIIQQTKSEVIESVKSALKIKNLGSINKSNVKKIINEIIKKYGHQYPDYASGVGSTPSSKSVKYENYRGFLPTTGGDEPYQFQNELSGLGFDDHNEDKWDFPYYFEMIDKKSGIIVSLTEGDVYLKIPRGK